MLSKILASSQVLVLQDALIALIMDNDMKLTVLKSLMTACLIGGVMMSSAHANNPAPTIKADAPNRYTVKKGDTLWDISGRYLNAPYRWREIWATNQQVKNPHLIYPGDILIMCIIKGQTLVGVDTGEGCAGIERQMQEVPAGDTPIQLNSSQDSVPTIPLSNIRHWLDRAVIVGPDDFETTPYVLASKKGNLITATGDKIYVKGALLTPGQIYGVYRKSEPYVDTRTGTVVGLEAIQVARGIVTDVSGNGVSSIQITQSFDTEIREGDRVFSEIHTQLPLVFYPAPAQVNRGGSIVRVMDSIGSAAKGSVVAINIGATQGARVGHVFDVYRKGALVRDVYDNDTPVRLPSEKAAQVMVFKAFDHISYAYVLSSELPLNEGDQLVPPDYL